MKRLLLLTLCSLSLVASSTAHAEEAALSGFGLKAGAGTSVGQFTSPDVKAQTAIGFGAGLQSFISINDYLAIAPELLFTMRTAQAPITGGSRANTHFDIQVPLALVLRLPILRSFTPRLSLGALGSYTLFGNTTDQLGSNTNTNEFQPDDFNALNFGVLAGLGFDIRLGDQTLTIDARIEQELTNRNGAKDENLGYNMQSLQFMVGFIL